MIEGFILGFIEGFTVGCNEGTADMEGAEDTEGAEDNEGCAEGSKRAGLSVSIIQHKRIKLLPL